jgi:opacity protein-like surface antigen
MKGMLWWGTILVLSVGCVGVRPQAVQGDSTRGWYLNGGLGLSRLDQEESKQPKADIGFRVAAACGFRFNRYWGIELDSGFIRNTFPDDPHFGEESPLSQIPLVVNALYYFPNQSKFEPYLGAGFGPTIAWNENDTGGDATLAFKAGVRYGIGERTAIGIDYTFFMLGITSAVIGEAVGDDTLNLGVRWMF